MLYKQLVGKDYNISSVGKRRHSHGQSNPIKPCLWYADEQQKWKSEYINTLPFSRHCRCRGDPRRCRGHCGEERIYGGKKPKRLKWVLWSQISERIEMAPSPLVVMCSNNWNVCCKRYFEISELFSARIKTKNWNFWDF